MKKIGNRGQITLELLIAITAYAALVGGALQIHSQTQQELKQGTINAESYRKISRTADQCTLEYFQGPSTKNTGNYTAPDQTEQNKLIKQLNNTEVTARTLSPEITLTKGRVKCSSTKPWYLQK